MTYLTSNGRVLSTFEFPTARGWVVAGVMTRFRNVQPKRVGKAMEKE